MKVPEFLKGVYYGKYQKFVHFFISLAIFLIIQKFFSLPAGLITALGIGILKELFDRFIRKTVFSLSDIFIDILGIITGLLIIILLNFNLTNMQITSPAFQNHQAIPARYTCDGENINPELNFLDIPDNAASLVLLMDDPDIPDFVKEKMGIKKFDHWTVFNMPADTTKIPENSTPPGVQGINSSGEAKYTGPCPPDGEHRYFFKLYALDTKLNLDTNANQSEIIQAIQSHILEQAELMGLYKRQ